MQKEMEFGSGILNLLVAESEDSSDADGCTEALA